MNFTVLWFILAALALILVFLLFAPVRFRLQYRDGFLFSVKYLFITYKADKFDEEADEEGEGALSKTVRTLKRTSREGEMGIVSLFVEVTKILVKLSKRLLSHAVVDTLYFKLDIAADDAAQTAVNYGAACAAVYPALGMLTALLRVREYEVDIRPDFNNAKTYGELDFVLKVRFVFVLYAFALALIRFVRFSAGSKIKVGVRSN